ncbi:hypothetical protein Holit_02158 [Hollandina sp. SP2]
MVLQDKQSTKTISKSPFMRITFIEVLDLFHNLVSCRRLKSVSSYAITIGSTGTKFFKQAYNYFLYRCIIAYT